MNSKALLFERFFQLAKEQGLFAFFLRQHGIDMLSYAFISMIYKSRTLEAELPRPILKQKHKRVEIAQHRVCYVIF